MLRFQSIAMLALETAGLLIIIALTLLANRLLKSLPPDSKIKRYFQPPLTEAQLEWCVLLLITLCAVGLTFYYA
jgi:hypothetical protein